MDTGALRHRITFQQKSAVVNSVGEATGWTNYYTCWASIDVLKSQMYYQTAEFIAQSTYEIVIRYSSSVVIDPSLRIVNGNDTYQIQTVTNTQQRNRELKILAVLINEAN